MTDFGGLRKLNPGLPLRFLSHEEAQDWLPYGSMPGLIEAKRLSDPNTYTEWAHWYNAWEEMGKDV